MIKQPVSIVTLTNVAIVKLKINKERFEIACYKNKIIQYRDKIEKDINEVLQISAVFSNAIKGDKVKKKVLDQFFPKMPLEEIIKLILIKGEIQISDKERDLKHTNTRKDVASLIVEKTYNKETGLPFPQSVILQFFQDLKLNIKENEDCKKQALKIIKLLKETENIPLERRKMSLKVSPKKGKVEFLNDVENYLKEINSEIKEYKKEEFIMCLIEPNFYRDLLTKFDQSKYL